MYYDNIMRALVMFKKITNPKHLSLVYIVLLFQIISYITILFNVPLATQLLLFVYFTFVPGYLIIKLLRLNFEFIEILVFSVGFSVAFLMIVGFAFNELGSTAGLSQPLSTVPLLIVLNSVILVLALLSYLRSGAPDLPRFSFSLLKWIFPLMLLIFLSIAGAIIATAYGDNRVLLLMIFMAASFAAILMLKSKNSYGIYAFAVFAISISLIYHSSVISKHICPFASDIAGEIIVFKYTQINGHWASAYPIYWNTNLARLSSMLSVTILPTIYSNLLNVESTWIFKLAIPFIFAFVPLCLYQLWLMFLNKKYAFISAFFFLAQFTFYTELLGLSRQMVGELFFVLLLLIIMNKKITPANRMICFMFFSFALVASHYALATIFLFFISFALATFFVLKRPIKNMAFMVILFFVLMFTWYIYTSGSATFNSILEVGDYVYRQLGDFFNLGARDEMVMRGLGLEAPPTVWNAAGRFFAYLTEAFIVLGFVGLVTKRVRVHMENEFFIFSIVGMAFLAMLISVPGLAESLNMTRFYHVLLFFLAPFCVLGGKFVVGLFFRREREFVVSVLLLAVLVPYFLFQTNFVYEVVRGDSWSIPLSGYRMSYLRLYNHYGYTDTYSIYGIKWLSGNVDIENSLFYMDDASRYYGSTIYGLIVRGKYPLSNVTVVADGGFVYLSTLNVVYGVVPYGQLSWNTTELSFIFDDLNLVYTNGDSEVLQKP